MRMLSFPRILTLVLCLILLWRLGLSLGEGLGLLGYFGISTEKGTQNFEAPASHGARTGYRPFVRVQVNEKIMNAN